jgi:hypothetical protein
MCARVRAGAHTQRKGGPKLESGAGLSNFGHHGSRRDAPLGEMYPSVLASSLVAMEGVLTPLELAPSAQSGVQRSRTSRSASRAWMWQLALASLAVLTSPVTAQGLAPPPPLPSSRLPGPPLPPLPPPQPFPSLPPMSPGSE